MLSGEVKKVAIIGGNRIPFVRSNTAYFENSNQEMLTAAIDGLVQRFNLTGEKLGEVVAGAVMKHSRDFNLTRECVIDTALSPYTPCYDVQQACGTGMEAAILVANKIALGQIDAGIAGGVDTTSDAPVGVNEEMRRIFMEINRAKSTGEIVKQALRFRPRHLVPSTPANEEPRTGLSMGEHCAVTAEKWGVKRETGEGL
jgi:acetyl-CoA C-acetyltransferase